VFIAGFEGPVEYADPAQHLFLALRDRPGVIVSSELTLAELLAPVRRSLAFPVAERRELYLNVLQRNVSIDLQPVTRSILIKTGDMRNAWGYKLADAIHVITAMETSCAYFVSNDDRIKQLPSRLRKIRADRSVVRELLRMLPQ
jgi:predicted nucleic acid-binding protein